MHASEDVMPIPVAYVPALQSVHAVWPAEENLPAGHDEQAALLFKVHGVDGY
jgi:hypothetical protein